MNRFEWFAYVILPLTILAMGWGVALWTDYSLKRERRAKGP